MLKSTTISFWFYIMIEFARTTQDAQEICGSGMVHFCWHLYWPSKMGSNLGFSQEDLLPSNFKQIMFASWCHANFLTAVCPTVAMIGEVVCHITRDWLSLHLHSGDVSESAQLRIGVSQLLTCCYFWIPFSAGKRDTGGDLCEAWYYKSGWNGGVCHVCFIWHRCVSKSDLAYQHFID